MSDTKHTPGPWHVEPNGFGFMVYAGDTVITYHAGERVDRDVEEANAALIAAAPETAAERDRLKVINAELLEALIEARKVLEWDLENAREIDEGPNVGVIELARLRKANVAIHNAAISSAKGESE